MEGVGEECLCVDDVGIDMYPNVYSSRAVKKLEPRELLELDSSIAQFELQTTRDELSPTICQNSQPLRLAPKNSRSCWLKP
uniref:Uncharacterized protein n=1 Tax=Oryza nivara TaxID=4536 RepID=A0A0E0GS60_ORYNI